jgi:uncharacterized paraquat-inducible protein A
MAKQCDECGTMVQDDEAPHCEACGGRNWHMPVRTWARLRQVITATLLTALLAFFIWRALIKP